MNIHLCRLMCADKRVGPKHAKRDAENVELHVCFFLPFYFYSSTLELSRYFIILTLIYLELILTTRVLEVLPCVESNIG